MEKINNRLIMNELSKNELKSISGGGPILEGAAWLLGYLSVKMEKIAKEGTHPAYTHNGGLK